MNFSENHSARTDIDAVPEHRRAAMAGAAQADGDAVADDAVVPDTASPLIIMPPKCSIQNLFPSVTSHGKSIPVKIWLNNFRHRYKKITANAVSSD